MKKLILLLLALFLIIPVIGITACDEECEHAWADATCTTPKTCTKCQATEGAALGHAYGSEWTTVTEATCGTDGLKQQTCSRCQAKVTASIPATGNHTPEAIPAVPPTCVTAGSTAGEKCSVCDKVTVQPAEDPATGIHNYSSKWSHNNDGHYHKCVNAGCTAIDTLVAHVDADKNNNCDVCNRYTTEFVTVTLKTVYEGAPKNVDIIKVKNGSAMTENDLEALAAVRYLGFGFKTWTYEDGTAFDPTAIIGEDLVIIGDRGDLAGEKITWSHNAAEKTLTLTGEGDMFDFGESNAVPWVGLDVDKVVLDEKITSIGGYSFYVKSLSSTGMRISNINLHEGITTICKYAFYGESLLTEVVFPESLTTINENAFRECTSLTYIDIGGKNIKTVGESAFANCESATYVIFNGAIDGVASVFNACKKLTHAYFAGNKGQFESVDIGFGNLQLDLTFMFFYADYKPTKAGPYWYRDAEGKPAQWCYSLYYIPADGIQTPIAQDYVFVDSNKLTAENIEFRKNIWYQGYQFEGWGSDKFEEGTVITGDKKYKGVRGANVGDGVAYNITDNVLTISGSGKMWDLGTVTSAPWDSAKNIDITEIVIGQNVTYIGDYAFCNLPNLQSVEIKSNIVEMSTKAFYGCANLKYIYYYGNELEALNCKGLNYQENVPNLAVYCQELENEKISYLTGKGIIPTIRYWKDIVVTPAVLGGEDGKTEITPAVTTRVTWEFADGVLTIGGEGAIPNVVDDVKTPWANTFYWIDLEESLDFDSIDVAVTKIVVRSGITEIGDNAFAGITAAAEVELPVGINRISATAFEGTSFITNAQYNENGFLIVNNNLIKVNATAVNELVLLPGNLITIAEGAFEGCTNVTAIRMPKSLAGATALSYSGLDALATVYFHGTDVDWKNNTTNGTLPATVKMYFFSFADPETCGYFWHILDNPEIYEEWLPVNPENGIHNYEDGVCTQCNQVCEHTYESGVCTNCGAAEEAPAA